MKKSDIAAIIGAAIVVPAMIYAMIHITNEEHERIRMFCQPRGYIGGYLEKFTAGGCVNDCGQRVSIDSIMDRERRGRRKPDSEC